MSLQADSPASRSASPASGAARPMTVTSGRICCDSDGTAPRWVVGKTFTDLLLNRADW